MYLNTSFYKTCVIKLVESIHEINTNRVSCLLYSTLYSKEISSIYMYLLCAAPRVNAHERQILKKWNVGFCGGGVGGGQAWWGLLMQ